MGVHGDQGSDQANEGGPQNGGPECRQPTNRALGGGPDGEPTPQGDSNPVRPPPASRTDVEANLQVYRAPEIIYMAEQPIAQRLDTNHQGREGDRSQGKPNELPPSATACRPPEPGR